MFPTSAFNSIQMGFQYPGQHPTGPIYQSQYGGFNTQLSSPFQQPPRGQSLPAVVRQYTPPGGPFIPTSSRRHGQYPPSVPVQHYEYRHHGSKNKKISKQRSASPSGVLNENLYSDKEKDDHSRSHTPVLESPSKQDESNNNDQEEHSQTIESDSGEISQGGTIGTEENENFDEKRQSRSKKEKHQRPEHYYNQFQPQPPPLYAELPPQMRVHQQPLYSGYNQAYEESIRRGDVYHKHAKRLTRLPPEIKQKLLPHEDDRQNQYQYPGYSQPIFNGIHPPFNPYQPGYFAPPTTPYNIPQGGWSNVGSAEQEIHRLRSHIHTLEGELNKLKKKLNKTTLNNDEHNRTKHDETGSPRQTPVIVELNNTTNETNHELSTKKKHRHRQGNHRHTQQGQNIVQQSEENTADTNIPNQQEIDPCEHSHSNGNQILETEGKPSKKTSREETAAQLAHAAAAHVNARQQVPPPPPVQQQEGFSPQTQQIRGPASHLPVGVNIRYPNESYQQRDIFNSNYNQSNNNEILDNNEERRNRRSADKILDAFERFYMNKSTTTPMKVKYIPEENNSNHFQQRNTNNNNNRDRSISQCLSSSTWSDLD